MLFSVYDKNLNLIISSFGLKFDLLDMAIGVCEIEKTKYRTSKVVDSEYVFFFCSSNDDDVNSNKKFISKINITKNYILNILQETNRYNQEMRHTIAKFNTKMIHRLYKSIEENSFKGNDHQQNKLQIKEVIKNNPEDISNLIISFYKNSVLLRNELSILTTLSPGSVPVLNKKNHQISACIMLIDRFFLKDFAEKKIRVEHKILEQKVNMDYEVFQGILTKIYENCVKYCLPETGVKINLRKNIDDLILEFQMTSIKVDKSESEKIFGYGYRSKHSKIYSGEGIGLSTVKRLCDLAGWKIEFIPSEITNNYKGHPYGENNIIRLYLKKVVQN